MSHTTKDFFGDGYTTYNDDGSTSHTSKDFFGDGYTTYHSDGSTSHTSKDFFGDGYTTYHSDGASSHTTKDFFGDGYTTYHSDGSTSHTTKDFFGDGYTTYSYGGSTYSSYGGYAGYGSDSGYSGYSGYGGYGGGYSGYSGYGGGYSGSASSSIPLGSSLGKWLDKLNKLMMWVFIAYAVYAAYRLYVFFSGGAAPLDLHAMTEYFLWAISAWAFTNALSNGDSSGPKIAGSVLFGIYLFVAGTAYYAQLGYGEPQAMQTWSRVFLCVLMFVVAMAVSGLAGKSVRLILSAITLETNRKNKLFRLLNCVVVILFSINAGLIVYEMLGYEYAWFASETRLLSYAALSVAWAFTDTLSNENGGAVSFFMVVGVAWYVIALLVNRTISIYPLNVELLVLRLWPCLAYVVAYKLAKVLGRKARKKLG